MISGKQFNHKSKSHGLIHGENGWGGRRIALESNFPNLTVVPIQIWPFLDQKEQEKKKKVHLWDFSSPSCLPEQLQ